MIHQTTGTEQVSHHFVNFNRPKIETTREVQPLVDAPKKASELIADKLLHLSHVQHQINELSRSEEHLKQSIKDYMGDCSILVDKNGTPLVSYKNQTKTILDTTKFKSAYPELFSLYSKQQTVRPFRMI